MKKLLRNVNTAFNWLNFIVSNMFMPMNSKKNWANGGTTEQTRNANKTNKRKPERTNIRASEKLKESPY